MSNRVYILYDSRACGGDTDEATVLEVCEDLEEAKRACGDYGGMACFSYSKCGKVLSDEQFEFNWWPPKRDEARAMRRRARR